MALSNLCSLGSSKMERDLNEESFARLERYVEKAQECGGLEESVRSRVASQMATLERAVWARASKNMEVLWCSAAVARTLGALRFTSCKSAKDRTAMSVTLEQRALLVEAGALQHFQESAQGSKAGALATTTRVQTSPSREGRDPLLDALRRHGLRRQNCLRNVGADRYAFTKILLLVVPREYRPPPDTYAEIET